MAGRTNPTIKIYTNANSGINSVTFVPLIVPVNCSAYMLKNAGPDALYMRSDPSDASTEDNMGAGTNCASSTTVNVFPFTGSTTTPTVFANPVAVTAAGFALCYLQTGTSPVYKFVLTYVQQ